MNKMKLAWTVVRADFAALGPSSADACKRRDVARIAKLRPAEVRRLILENRIPVRALVEKSN